jgi:type II restriction enzyme
MNLSLPTRLVPNYKSASQIARVTTEEWGLQNHFCAACESDRVVQAPPNTKAIDFRCPSCSQAYQLKSRRNWSQEKVVDAAYSAMMDAIRTGKTPNFFVLEYTPSWTVHNLLLIPHFLVSESAIEKRKPLGPSARRAGWVGCNILLHSIPPEGKIRVVDHGTPLLPDEVRRRFNHVQPLSQISPKLRGWAVDVLRMVRALHKQTFSLSDAYQFEKDLSCLYPSNKHVRAKIRQQLQVLRDAGILQFHGQGRYSFRSEEA